MTSPPFLVMVKAKNGRTKLEGLTMKSTIGNLLQKISEFTEIPSKSQKLLHGYPPKPLDISNHGQELASLPFKSGDMVIVEEVVISNQTDGTRGSSDPEATMTRRVVPADNSCLFMSIALLMEGGNTDSSRAQELRNLIVSVVSSNPELYNEAFLGKSNSMYCQWIKNPDTWGGAIEISILTEFYETEIAVVDTQTGRVDRFGEDNDYKHRIYLIYDNVHYDPLIKELEGGGTETVFGVDDEDVLSQVLKLAKEAQKSRQYTDLSDFTLRCLVCNDGLRGQRQARQHAMATGHSNFAEY